MNYPLDIILRLLSAAVLDDGRERVVGSPVYIYTNQTNPGRHPRISEATTKSKEILKLRRPHRREATRRRDKTELFAGSVSPPGPDNAARLRGLRRNIRERDVLCICRKGRRTHRARTVDSIKYFYINLVISRILHIHTYTNACTRSVISVNNTTVIHYPITIVIYS